MDLRLLEACAAISGGGLLRSLSFPPFPVIIFLINSQLTGVCLTFHAQFLRFCWRSDLGLVWRSRFFALRLLFGSFFLLICW